MNNHLNVINRQAYVSRKWKKDLSKLTNFLNIHFPYIPIFIEDISTYIELNDYETNRIKTIQTIGRIIRKDNVDMIIDLKKEILFPICWNSLSNSEVFFKTPRNNKNNIWEYNAVRVYGTLIRKESQIVLGISAIFEITDINNCLNIFKILTLFARTEYRQIPTSKEVNKLFKEQWEEQKRLKLNCIPQNETHSGPSVEVESKNIIEAGPGHCPFDTRHMFTKSKLTGNSFRVTSYNILANVYASTTYSKENLFPYCPEYALDIDYRKQLILKELLGFNSDIICLQEVDNKIYDNDFMPTLSLLQYKSIFNTKNESSEGLAVFFNKERFEELCYDSTVIGNNTELPKFALIWSKIQNEKAKKRFSQKNTTVQVLALRARERLSDILVIANTHLYFHPDADHIRLLQAYYILLYIENFTEKIKQEHPQSNVSILLCGDFNSVPECGIYQLMTENYIPENYKDWSSNLEETVKDVSLTYNIRFASACGTPIYTNYTPEFAGCLDYIFYEKNKFEVEQIIPMPSNEELTIHIGLPSIVLPSDHISLCADLKWIT
ncbi:2',5'-phosphodiesterase 12 isoform X2 [Vespa crabro]|uniref:2',5'-phosphodiesterase 12 isoform X2 n=1 Tax=Vespa crabro TaxID=7445 RepID=UPI001F0247E5|nr:2',5'-phosphodiesterase 12 isoform X2 [Vespa crabro]